MSSFVLCLPFNASGETLVLSIVTSPASRSEDEVAPPLPGHDGFRGNVQPGEAPADAAIRVFYHATGVLIPAHRWQRFARLSVEGGIEHVFCTFDDAVMGAERSNNAQALPVGADMILTLWRGRQPRLPWLVGVALEQRTVPFFLEGQRSTDVDRGYEDEPMGGWRRR